MTSRWPVTLCLMVYMMSVRAENRLKGPYRTTMVSFTKCSKTSLPPMTRNPAFVSQVGFVNTTKKNNVLIGNITVLRSIRNITATAGAYKWEDGKWIPHIKFPTLSCETPVITTVTAIMTNVKFDLTECIILKGSYHVEFDINVADHIWLPEREYGRVRWKIEFNVKKYTIGCFCADTVVEPINN
ncbi:uncharacterized protein LOC114350167 [Ostrinia furnacalis]|uniref:uncharacterized protein LOC114350167 n=1 Tax=Ostrinia furnacalis TaxID=93504 RepID=UPI00103B32CD|nr:uncharacterized protein LOC114350167 [Ostrinia furnacalis]